MAESSSPTTTLGWSPNGSAACCSLLRCIPRAVFVNPPTIWRLFASTSSRRNQLGSVVSSVIAWVTSTFHSFGLRVNRSWSQELGFGELRPAVFGREDARAVLRETARELGLVVRPEHVAAIERDPWALSLTQLERALQRNRLRNASAGTRYWRIQTCSTATRSPNSLSPTIAGSRRMPPSTTRPCSRFG